MTDNLPTDLMIAAQTRLAAQQGVPIVVRQRGGTASGALLVKINRLDGTAHVLTQARLDDEIVWTPVGRNDPMQDDAAERALARSIAMDPDLWVVEIEDRQGRTWFPGKVMKL
jgi:hypothetical protein